MFSANRQSLSSLPSDSSQLNYQEQLGMDLNPTVVTPSTLLKDLVAKMSQATDTCNLYPLGRSSRVDHRCSYVLVLARNRLLGIVTERDLVKLTAEGVCFANMTALRVMTSNLITLKASQIKDTFGPLSLMRQYRIRHLPVLNDQDEVVGVITAARLREVLPASALLKRRLVKEVMATEIITSIPKAPIIEVAKLMAKNRVSCLVIQESDEVAPQGIITEYDIVQLQRLELNLTTVVAETVMSTPLVCLHPEDHLWDAQEKMHQLHVRRLVVVNENRSLAGLVTQTSILSVLNPHEMSSTIEILQQQVDQLKDERVKLLQELNSQLEQKVQASESSLLVCEENFRATFEQAAVGIAHLSLEGQFIKINLRFCQIFGYQQADLQQQYLAELTHLEDRGRSQREIERLMRGEIPFFSQEMRYLRLDGNIFLGKVNVSIATQSGASDYLIAFLEEISHR